MEMNLLAYIYATKLYFIMYFLDTFLMNEIFHCFQ